MDFVLVIWPHLRSFVFFFSSRRRHTRYWRDWSSDVCSSDLSSATRLGCEEYFQPERVAELAGHYGGLLPYPIRSEERRVGKECRCRGAGRRCWRRGARSVCSSQRSNR